MSEPLISVIIPVYKVEAYLARCLDSVLNNTYKNIEVICINDGSPDGCLEILKKYKENDPRIQIINKENQGVSAARNDGLRIASGEWITFIDSDDWIHPRFFEVLIDIAAKTDADIVAGDYIRAKSYEEFTEINEKELEHSRTDLKTIYKKKNLRYFVWGKIFKKEVVSNLWFDEEVTYGEDSLFNINIYCNADKLAIINCDAKLYYYYDREGSAVNSIDTTNWIKQCKTYFDAAQKTNNEVAKMICFMEGYKRLFLARYTEMYTNKRLEVIRDSNKLLRSNIKNMLGVNGIKAKEKIVYMVFSYIPQAYRCFRLIDDPTMKEWEKNQIKQNTFNSQ